MVHYANNDYEIAWSSDAGACTGMPCWAAILATLAYQPPSEGSSLCVHSTGHARRLCQSSPETKPEEGKHSGNKTMNNGWTWNNNIR